MPVGDIARLGVVVPDAVGLQFTKKLGPAFVVQVFDPAAATRGHHFQLLRIRLEKTGHERTAARLEIAENANLIGKAFFGLGSAKLFVNAPVVAHANRGAKCILHLLHAGKSPLARRARQAICLPRRADRGILPARMSDPVRFQHYEVARRADGSLEELGRGAMGITYKAFDTNLRCFVALKVINAQYLENETARQRFLREARAAAALRHPNVAAVFHLGEEGGDCFYAMEFVDGETVESLMKRAGAIPPATALEITLQVARALGAAQKQGLVHRDIKPSNLMIVREDELEFTVKVIDFGLAKNAAGGGNEEAAILTMGGFLGTPHFASPEQLEERELDVRSDIYSLGVTLYYMLAGRAPFSGSIAQVMSQHLHREPPIESLGPQAPAVLALLRRMLAKDPAGRPQTPAEVRSEIEAALTAVRAAPAQTAAPVISGDSFETQVMDTVAAPDDLSVGKTFAGRFCILAEEPAGEWGRVFRARETGRSDEVTILLLERLADPAVLTALEKQVLDLQKVTAAGVQKVHSLEHVGTVAFLVIERVGGPTLLDWMRTRRGIPVAEAAPVLEDLAEAFEALLHGGLPCPDLSAHEVFLPGAQVAKPVGEWTRVGVKFLPLRWPSAASAALADATLVTSPFSLLEENATFVGRHGAGFVFVLATLAYELLGGVRGGSVAGSPVPIPGLSEAANTLLRQALDPHTTTDSPRAFVSALIAENARPATRVPPSVVLPSPPPRPPEGRRSALPMALGAVAVLFIGGATVAFFALKPTPTSITEIAPAPVVVSEPTPPTPPIPTPTPDPFLAEFEAAQRLGSDDPAAGLTSLLALSKSYPARPEVRPAIDLLLAPLAESDDPLSPGREAAMRPALENAASRGIPLAQFLLARQLFDTDPAGALKLFSDAGKAGHVRSMIQAGQMLASGRGVGSADLAEAVVWFRRAADADDPMGKFLLGECYFRGAGIPTDKIRAIQLITEAADAGQPEAMNHLGDLYNKGIPGVLAADPARAFELFSSASALGFMDARGNLGVLHMMGAPGIERNPELAVALFREGMDAGNAACTFFYASSLERGLGGLTADPTAAKALYIRAAKLGNRAAQDWCRKHDVAF